MIISKDLFLLGDQDYLRLPKDDKRAMGHKSAKRWVFGLAGMGQGRSGVGGEGTSCEPNNRLRRRFRYFCRGRPGVGSPPRSPPLGRPSDPLARGVERARWFPSQVIDPGYQYGRRAAELCWQLSLPLSLHAHANPCCWCCWCLERAVQNKWKKRKSQLQDNTIECLGRVCV